MGCSHTNTGCLWLVAMEDYKMSCPEIIAERDKLREVLRDLLIEAESREDLDAYLEAKKNAHTILAKGSENISPTLQARIEQLEAEKAELLECMEAISSLHGNMSLESISQVNGINDGRDRAIKLRAAMEISRAAIAKLGSK